MRRVLSLLVVAGLIATGSATAASAVLATRPLGAGGAAVGRCDADGFSFVNRLDTAGNVTAVAVLGVGLACAGGTLSLTLGSGAGAGIGSGVASLPATGFGGSIVVTVTPQPAVGSVAAYRLVIAGP